jgi:ElaB/YqjD/DUF883 family membrane-anchored ribosome-binding protein
MAVSVGPTPWFTILCKTGPPIKSFERIDAKSVRFVTDYSRSARRNESMNEQAEKVVADAGEAVQRGLNQAEETKDQLSQYIRDNPIPAALVAVGIGYLLGKII